MRKKDFPLKQTWTPGVYGNWEEFEGKIKEAAATYASPGFKKDLQGMIFEGQSKKRDGSTRFWDHAEATGNYFVSRDGSVMLEVYDLSKGDKRHLNISTFSGDAVSDNAAYEFKNGAKTTKQQQMALKMSSMLDSLADRLEAKGFKKEAAELDVVANTIDNISIPGKRE